MVKTRHRGELEDDSFDGFVSIPRRQTRTRQAVDWVNNGLDSDTEEDEVVVSAPSKRRSMGVTAFTKQEAEDEGDEEEEEEEEEEEVEIKPRRKRRSFRRNYQENDEVEQNYRRSTRRSAAVLAEDEEPTRSQREPASEHETGESDTEDQENVSHSPKYKSSPRITKTRSSGRTPRKQYSLRRSVESEDDDADVYVNRDEEKKTRYRRHSGHSRKLEGLRRQSRELDMNGALDDHSIRRSTRQRKLLYGTFNQSLIEKHVMLCGEEGEEEELEERPVRKRKRYNATASEQEEDGLDMYSRVKRKRRQIKRDMYGIPVTEPEEHRESGDSSDTTEDEVGEEGDEDGEVEPEPTKQSSRQYYLRQHKPRTNLYEAPPIEPQRPRSRNIFRSETPPRTFKRVESYRSPAHRTPKFRSKKKPEPKKPTPQRKVAEAEAKKATPSTTPRRRPAFHGNSSTSSSSSSDSENERRFERRKAKSMARNRSRCLPMNFLPDDIKSGVKRDRTKIGSSLADVDPMAVDKSVMFDKIGGLGKHIRALKEMIVFPLLYPEVFERFKISPPRGVLFYGPPGTGKTLVARALANECSSDERKVAFFMRKGADCLSKWVGESERQLRLLFDQAYQMRPSIIFFDEIDGLAPVRSSRQDQIHSSIVSTLLALMDGLDNRGEVVVIGATNRLDSIDPALRRPGRFDREFLFPLPNVEARAQILGIHTREWNPLPCHGFLKELGEKCVGYCGADLKALCTEGALHALRRRYPQIYTSEDKLELDVSTIEVSARDFHKAMQNIVPASQRSTVSPARSLDHIVQPLLQITLKNAVDKVLRLFPSDLMKFNSLDAPVSSKEGKEGNPSGSHEEIELYSDVEDNDTPAIYESTGRNGKKKRNSNGAGDVPAKSFLSFTLSASQRPMTYRPRLLLTGEDGQGQSTHLGPALLHYLERVPVHVLDLPALYGVSSRSPEEACAQVFREARRTSPSIIYMPHMSDWWDVIQVTLQATFMALLQDIQPDLPILLLATSETRYHHLPEQVRSLFSDQEVVNMTNPSEEERREFFRDLLLEQTKQPPRSRRQAAARVLEVLPKAKVPEPRELTEVELKQVQKQEEKQLRELRIFLRDILNKLGRDRKFAIFAKPVDTEDVPDYYEIIQNPMDMSTMMAKIDLCQYSTVKDFVTDIDLICSNALEYNPDRDPAGRAIRHRACALRDTCNALIEEELDPDFEKLCEEVKSAQVRRGETPSKTVPRYYYTRPLVPPHMADLANSPGKYPSRYSRRTRGMNAEEDEEDITPQKITGALAENFPSGSGEVLPTQSNGPRIRAIVKRVHNKLPPKTQRNKSPWCRTRRKRFRKIIVYVDEFGNEVDSNGARKVEKPEDKNDENKGEEEPKGEKVEEMEETAEDMNETINYMVEESEEKKTVVEEEEGAPSAEGSEEKENKPVVPPGSPRSIHCSPCGGATPSPGMRTSTRSSRSASMSSHTGILTRSTSPRSTSPRGSANLDRQLDNVHHRSTKEPTSPKSSPIADSIQKTPSPRSRRVRRPSARSSHSDADPMEISPTQKVDSPPAANPAPSSHPNSPSNSPKSSRNLSSPQPEPTTRDRSPKTKQQNSPSTTKTPTTTAAVETGATNEQDETQTVQSVTEAKDADPAEMEEKVEEEKDKIPSPKMRMTRSRTQVPAAVTAMAKRVLETEVAYKVVLDEDKLRQLLATTVVKTHGYNVENLEKLYSHISQAIYYHRQQVSKEELLQDIDEIISNLPVIQR